MFMVMAVVRRYWVECWNKRDCVFISTKVGLRAFDKKLS